MLKKVIVLTLFLLLIVSNSLFAAEASLEEIQSLISQGKTEEALSILKSSDLNLDPDLKFYKALLLSWQEDYEEAETILLGLIESNPDRMDSYNQLGRIYGWQREFIKAEEITEKAQNIEYSSERTALLSRHAEWQGNYFEAKRLIEEAAAEAESAELKSEYEENLKRINDLLKALFYLEGRAVYSESEKEDLDLRFGFEKPLRDGLNLNMAAGANYFAAESNFIFKSDIEITQPLVPEKTSFNSGVIFYSGGSRDKYEFNNNLNYLVNPQNRLGINYNFVENNLNPDYQTLELEYEHQFKQTIMVLKNSSRRYSDGWTVDFSQHLDLYYPRENYLLNLSLNHYNGGEYVFKVGFQFSDLFSGDKFSLSSLNLWFNNQKTSNLDFRMDLK